MRDTGFRILLCATTAMGAGLSAPASAQSSQAFDTGDIIVTARRTEERLQDVPISITVFNQQQLSNRNVVNAQDLATYTPSLSANTNFGSENSTFAIRGFIQETNTAPSVGVYFADVVAPRGASNGLPSGDGAGPGNFFDLANVQVLKGPQGTLFGRNTTGGAVLLVPQKPTGRFEGYVEGSVGNYDMRRVQAVVNIPVMETLRLRFGLDRQTRDGYLKNVGEFGPKDFADVDYWALRASIVADLTPNLENYTVISYSKSDNSGPIQPVIAAAPGLFGSLAQAQLARMPAGFYNVVQTLNNPSSKSEQWQIINTTTWTASDTLTIKNVASYAQLKQDINAPLFGTDFIVDFRGTPLAAAGGPYHIPFSTVTTPTGLHTAHQYTLTEELQIQGRTADDRLIWQMGGYLESSQPLGTGGSNSAFMSSCRDIPSIQCTDPVGYQLDQSVGGGFGFVHLGSVNYTVGRTYYHNVGVYSQATYKLTEKLKLTGGFRYTWDHSRNVSEQRVNVLAYPPNYGLAPVSPALGLPQNPRCTNPKAIPTGCVSTFYQATDKPTWLVGVDFTPMEDMLLYAKYARGYRAGSIIANISDPFNILRPEKVDSYEVGLKTSFRGAVRGTFNVAGFYNDFSNQQLQLGFNSRPGSGQGSTSAPVNAGKSEIWGFEVDGSITPVEGLKIDAGYTYLRTKIKEVPDFSGFVDPTYILSAPFKVGDPEILSPRNKYSITATYTLPLDESIGRISVGATFTHRDSMLSNYSDKNNPDPRLSPLSWLPALDLLNLNASWNSVMGAPIDLSLFVTNVTKRKYYTFIASLGSPELNFETATVGEPRMFGARLRYRFGD